MVESGRQIPSCSADGSTDVYLAEDALGAVSSVEMGHHLLLRKRFEGIETEAARFEGGAGVRRNQLGVLVAGNRKFCRSHQ